MTRKGRRKEPAAKRGADRKQRTDSRPPNQDAAVPNPPDWLGATAKEKWCELAPVLAKHGLLTDLDHDSLASFCDAFQELVDATNTVAKHGEYFETDKGWIAQHPAVFKRNKALERMRRMSIELGLSPQSRRNLDVAATDDKVDPLMEFLKQRPS